MITDIAALYGVLKDACKRGVGKSILKRYSNAQDGLKAWLTMVKKYEGGGDKESRLDLLENIISNSYTKNYEGGLLAWSQDYKKVFEELVFLNQQNRDCG